jgi:Spy/CpxP family protein refolding chaperone
MKKQITPTAPVISTGQGEKHPMKIFHMLAILLLIVIDLIFLIFIPLWAQEASAQMGGSMSPPMGYGMMRGQGRPGMMPPSPRVGEGMPPESRLEGDLPFWENIQILGLEERQIQQIKEIRDQFLLETIKQRTELQFVAIKMKELLEKDPVDLVMAETVLKQRESAKLALELSSLRAVEEAKSILTQEQRKKIQEVLKKENKMREGPRGHFDR